MVNNQRIEVCYNVQATVDAKHKLILDHEVTNEVKDQHIPEPKEAIPKEIGIPEPGFYKDKFEYAPERDVYICPAGKELTYRNTAEHHGKRMRLYKSKECLGCQLRGVCTRNKMGRIIYRWEHEEILEDMRKRIEANRQKVRQRQWLSEHPFGTIKRSFNQGCMLMRGIAKAGAEISLSVLAYNMTRAMNIVGIEKMIKALA